MTHLGISHLANRQTNRTAAGIQRDMGMFGKILIQSRRVRFGDSVVKTAWIDTKAIENNQ